MFRFNLFRLAVCAALSVLGLVSVANAASPRYSVTPIGTFGGDTFVWGINNYGQVSGWSYDTVAGYNRAFIFSGGVLTNLGTFGGRESIGTGINDAGQVVITVLEFDGKYQTLLWSGGTATNIGTLGGYWASGLAINNSGQVTGVSTPGPGNGDEHGFIYSGGVMTDLGTLGGSYTEARAINNLGQIAGTSTTGTAGVPQHAFIWTNGVMTDLGLLPGSDSVSTGEGINDSGEVVGGSHFSATGAPLAYRWSNGVMIDLGTLPGSVGSIAYDINNAGVVVGGDLSSTGINRAIIWLDGTPVDLNSLLVSPILGWTLDGARAINEAGQIVANGINSLGQTRAFLLTPIIDSVPPVISGMPIQFCSLWPPNHEMVQVAIVTATDAQSGIATGSLRITGSSNEPSDPESPDIVITSNGSGGFSVQLRAERLGQGTGRIYTLTARAMDLAGNSAFITASCTVPLGQRK